MGDCIKMTLGTGVFLSSALLGFILLFVVTKDRWNWRKLGISLGVIVVVIPVAIVVYDRLSHDVSHTFYRLTASKQSELWGIKLGSSKSDVLFLKGKPTPVNPFDQFDPDAYLAENDFQRLESAFLNAHKAGDTKAARVLAGEINRLRNEGSKRKPEQQVQRVKRNVEKMISLKAPPSDIDGYLKSEGFTPEQFKSYVATSAVQTTPDALVYSDYVVNLDDNGVVRVIRFLGKHYNHEGFFGIRVGTRVEDLQATLGAPSSIKTAPDKSGLWRRYDYKKYNLRFLLREGKVSSYAVYDFSGREASQSEK